MTAIANRHGRTQGPIFAVRNGAAALRRRRRVRDDAIEMPTETGLALGLGQGPSASDQIVIQRLILGTLRPHR